MIDLGTYEFKILNKGKITSEELFMNDYTEEINKQEKYHNCTKRLLVILYGKNENTDLNKVIEN